MARNNNDQSGKQEQKRRDIPVGLGMALSMNVPAMERFASMSAAQQDAVMNSASRVHSKGEMQSLVEQIAEGTLPGAF